jgi:hypothetical protein
MDALALFITLAWLRAVGWLLARALIQYRAYEMLEPAESRPLTYPSVQVVVDLAARAAK